MLLPYGMLNDVRISEYIASNNKILNYSSVGRLGKEAVLA
jgi:hypothetical protein